ncbi:MAG: ketoacyl-ACP synthase III [Pseudomonadota bacterium]
MRQKAVSESIGVGHYFPDEVIKSDDLMSAFDSEKRFGLPSRYLTTLVGIEERRWAPAGTMPSTLAIEASAMAIERANISPGEIDCVIYCGIERDWQEPATAHQVQNVLGASGASCFDVSNACHGFMNGLGIADAFIANGTANICLVCTGEVGSVVVRKLLEQMKQPNCRKSDLKVLIGGLTAGDAGAAMILRRAEGPAGFKQFKFQSNGAYTHLCQYNHAANDEIYGEMHMEEICKATLSLQANTIHETYRSLEWSPSDVDRLICHQVGSRAHRQVCRLADVSPDCAPVSVRQFGNIASATIPVLISLNPPSKGDKVLILSSGSGLTIGQSAMIA